MECNNLFFAKLVEFVPELKKLYNQHLEDNNCLLSYVFMSDITRFVIGKAISSDQLSDVQVILDTIESELSKGDDEFKNLVLASFVENLFGEEIAITKIYPMMGPILRAEIVAMRVI